MSIKAKRIAVRISMTISLAVVVLYAFQTVIGHHQTAPYLLVAPLVGCLSGLFYLRSTASRER